MSNNSTPQFSMLQGTKMKLLKKPMVSENLRLFKKIPKKVRYSNNTISEKEKNSEEIKLPNQSTTNITSKNIAQTSRPHTRPRNPPDAQITKLIHNKHHNQEDLIDKKTTHTTNKSFKMHNFMICNRVLPR